MDSEDDLILTEEQLAAHNEDFNILAESLAEDGVLRDRFPCDNCRKLKAEGRPPSQKVKCIFVVLVDCFILARNLLTRLIKVRWL